MSNTLLVKRFIYNLKETKKRIIHILTLATVETDEVYLPFRHMLKLLELSIKFLEPLENETSEPANHFFTKHHFFSEEQNATLKLRKILDSLYTECKKQNPIDFYTKPYEQLAHYLFVIVLLLLILTTTVSIAAMFIYTFTSMQILGFILINTAIGATLTTIGLLQLQKSKKLQDAFDELKLYDESNIYNLNNFNLFHLYQDAESRQAIV